MPATQVSACRANGSARQKWLIRSVVLAVLAPVVLASSPAQAATSEPIKVVSYDVLQTPRSGWGCWTHEYTGAIANVGRTVSGSVVCSADGNQIANYTGGSGTLNDGLTMTTTSTEHLFVMRPGDDGLPIQPEITPRFADPVFIDRIVIHGGSSIFAGGIDTATVRIGDQQATITATPSGQPNPVGVPSDDILDLTGTSLSTIPTTEATVKEVVTSFFGSPFDQLAIAEITVEGRPAAPQAVEVELDIRPAATSNQIRLSSRVPVPIAVLSSTSVDVASIDKRSLRFGRLGTEDSLRACAVIPDINKDRRRDLVCLAAVDRTGFRKGDTVGRLTGTNLAGLTIEGTDSVTIIR